MDFEYKKVMPGWLEIKQVREVPDVHRTNQMVAYLLDAPFEVRSDQGEPWRILGDSTFMTFSAEYTNLVPSYSYGTQLTNDLRAEGLCLLPAPPREDSDARLDYAFVITNGTQTVVINTGFWATNPEIYTDYPRLKGEIETRIEGLTTAPIELRGFFSQTWSSVHHRYADRFVFEPRLGENLARAILDELNTADIRFLLVTHLDNIPRLQIMGLDGVCAIGRHTLPVHADDAGDPPDVARSRSETGKDKTQTGGS